MELRTNLRDVEPADMTDEELNAALAVEYAGAHLHACTLCAVFTSCDRCGKDLRFPRPDLASIAPVVRHNTYTVAHDRACRLYYDYVVQGEPYYKDGLLNCTKPIDLNGLDISAVRVVDSYFRPNEIARYDSFRFIADDNLLDIQDVPIKGKNRDIYFKYYQTLNKEHLAGWYYMDDSGQHTWYIAAVSDNPDRSVWEAVLELVRSGSISAFIIDGTYADE